MTELDKQIAVINHRKNGGTVERRLIDGNSWYECSAYIGWNFNKYVYRPKEEPKVAYVNLYDNSASPYGQAHSNEANAIHVSMSNRTHIRVMKMVEVPKDD